MRIWRNWQTRWFQVPVGDHAGSTPVIRTKKMTLLFVGVIFFLVRILQELRGGKAEAIFCRRAADSTAVLTALGLGCQPCAALKRLLLLSAPKRWHCFFVGVIFFLVRILQELRGGKAEIIFCRRAAGSTAVLTALGLGCQPCAAPKRLLLLSAPKTAQLFYEAVFSFL